MSIILPIQRPFTNLIFSGVKPVEFRNRLPRLLKIGDRIFIYESKCKNGKGKVVGFADVKDIQEIDKGVRYGAYILSQYYLPLYGTSEEIDAYSKVKAIQIEGVKKGFAIQNIMEDKMLDFFMKNKRQMNINELQSYLSNNQNQLKAKMSSEFNEKVDEWGERIGFYDKYGESHWRYAILLENPTLYDLPKEISEFKNLDGITIRTAPQSFCYVKDMD